MRYIDLNLELRAKFWVFHLNRTIYMDITLVNVIELKNAHLILSQTYCLIWDRFQATIMNTSHNDTHLRHLMRTMSSSFSSIVHAGAVFTKHKTLYHKTILTTKIEAWFHATCVLNGANTHFCKILRNRVLVVEREVRYARITITINNGVRDTLRPMRLTIDILSARGYICRKWG